MKIGMTEILLILIIALFVIGPDKLPEFMQKLGAGLKQFRKFSSEATKEIRENVVEPLEEAQKPLREAMEPVTELTREVSDDVNGIKKSFTDLTKPVKITPAKTASKTAVPEEEPKQPETAGPEPEQPKTAVPETEPVVENVTLDSTNGVLSESARTPADSMQNSPPPEFTDHIPDEPGAVSVDDIVQASI